MNTCESAAAACLGGSKGWSGERPRERETPRWTGIQRARPGSRERIWRGGDLARRQSRAGRPCAAVSAWLQLWATDAAEEGQGRGVWAGAKGGQEFINSCAGREAGGGGEFQRGLWVSPAPTPALPGSVSAPPPHPHLPAFLSLPPLPREASEARNWGKGGCSVGQRGPGGDGEEAGRLGLVRARARRVTGVPGRCPAGTRPLGERQETAAEESGEGGGELPAPCGRQGAGGSLGREGGGRLQAMAGVPWGREWGSLSVASGVEEEESCVCLSVLRVSVCMSVCAHVGG